MEITPIVRATALNTLSKLVSKLILKNGKCYKSRA